MPLVFTSQLLIAIAAAVVLWAAAPYIRDYLEVFAVQARLESFYRHFDTFEEPQIQGPSRRELLDRELRIMQVLIQTRPKPFLNVPGLRSNLPVKQRDEGQHVTNVFNRFKLSAITCCTAHKLAGDAFPVDDLVQISAHPTCAVKRQGVIDTSDALLRLLNRSSATFVSPELSQMQIGVELMQFYCAGNCPMIRGSRENRPQFCETAKKLGYSSDGQDA